MTELDPRFENQGRTARRTSDGSRKTGVGKCDGHVVSFDRVENLLITHVSEVDFSAITHGV
jgi:hypothetical protein